MKLSKFVKVHAKEMDDFNDSYKKKEAKEYGKALGWAAGLGLCFYKVLDHFGRSEFWRGIRTDNKHVASELRRLAKNEKKEDSEE